MDNQGLYKPQYANSYALVVGIDNYVHASPLTHAANDANEIADVLINRFHFPKENVVLLLNNAATKIDVLRSYMSFADTNRVGRDDRILFFFAGHGYTVRGRRDTGFLIPADGDAGDLSSLIRWDELTRNADLIPAKHIFFVMDACYGGLAVHRRVAPVGSMRFLQDILRRYSRQVLAAGKPDQPVSDGGGTRPGHSIFTSHVLDALENAGAFANGLITANSLMAYVYEKVGGDEYSHQTPHYGSFEGDGDFIFDPTVVSEGSTAEQIDEREGNELLIQVPDLPDTEPSEAETLGQRVKGLIPNPADRIRLDDLVSTVLRIGVKNLGPQAFPATPEPGDAADQFARRVQKYDDAITDLQIIVALLAHWGEQGQVNLLSKVFSSLAEAERPLAGSTLWLSLAAYPVLALMYAGGISALAGNRYDMLRSCLLTPVRWARPGRQEQSPIIIPIVDEVTSIFNAFKSLPGMERKYVPRNEHHLAAIQPIIEDQLFLGRSYEELFDQFEIMLALVHGDINGGTVTPFWGPPGRFAYKERSIISGERPFSSFVKMVNDQGQAWPGFNVGFFNGAISRFNEVAQGYSKLIASINVFV